MVSGRGLVNDLDSVSFNRGLRAAERGDHVIAVEIFAELREANDASAAFNQGNSFRSLGRSDEALEAYEVAISGGASEAFLNRGLLLRELGRQVEALEAFIEAGKAGYANGFVGAGDYFRVERQWDQAESYFRRAVAMGSRYADAALGSLLWECHHDLGAEGLLRSGRDVSPSARASLASLLWARGKIFQARRVLESGVANDETSSMIVLGNLLWHEFGDPKGAEREYRRGISSGDDNCHYNLSRLLTATGRASEASAESAIARSLGAYPP